MRRNTYNRPKRMSTGRLLTGILLGGAVAATVAWLNSPATEGMPRSLFKTNTEKARDRFKTAENNIESQVRDLIEDVSDEPARDADTFRS